MMERLLRVTIANDPAAPSRICGLLAQRSVVADSIQMVRGLAEGSWIVQLVVSADNEADLNLVSQRLNRLVSVVSVVEVGSERNEQRQSVFVTLEPGRANASRVGEIARMFSAEVMVLASSSTVLHLCADPDRCAQFVAVLDAYNITSTHWGAVTGTFGSAYIERPLSAQSPVELTVQ
jgi:acetolactate synthase-1/3 small subunit